jgi:hypothetical protein
MPHDSEPTLEQFQELLDLIDEMPISQVEQLLSSVDRWADTLTFWTSTRSRMDELLDSIHETEEEMTT